MHQEFVRLKYGSPPADSGLSDRKLDLQVIFTDLPRTAAALATARVMARGLGARITVIVAQVVPYPLPLAAPDVPLEFTERAMESLRNQGDFNDTTIEIYLCRDRNEAIRRALPPDSLAIVGARSWRDRHLVKFLRHDGRRVLVVNV